MHWLLSVPDAFSLRDVIRRSVWLAIPSLHAEVSSDRLHRVEHLSSGTIARLTIYQAPAGLVIHTDSHLTGSEIQEASQKSWRMLRLDENLQPFLRLTAFAEGLHAVRRNGARLLRGTTLFEDVIVAALATWDDKGSPRFPRVASLVDRLGLALPRNPTLHAFPTPERVFDRPKVLVEQFGTEDAERVKLIATAFVHHRPQLETLAQQRGPLHRLTRAFSKQLGLSPDAISLLMLSIGRYDHIPTNEAATRRFRRAVPGPQKTTSQDLMAMFSRYQPWGGLAFWLWDWSATPGTQSV